MSTTKFKALRCKISRGGFSDERVFTLEIGDGYSGVGSRRHMWDSDGNPIEEGEPPIDKVIDGYVAAYVLKNISAKIVLVSIPDGEVIEIPSKYLKARPRAGQNVPV